MSSQATPTAISPVLRRRKIPAVPVPPLPVVGSISPPRSTAVHNAGFSVFRHKRSDSPEITLTMASPPTPKSSSSGKRNVTERLQRLRRKLNPRPNAARWRYRLSTHQRNISQDQFAEDFDFGNEEDDDSVGVEDLVQEHQMLGIVETGDAWETSSLSGLRARASPPPSVHALASSDTRGMAHKPATLATTGRSVSFDLSALEPPSVKTTMAVAQSPNNNSSSNGFNFKMDHQQSALSQHSTSPNLRKFGSDRKEFRVRPFSCFSEPVYMTEAEIYHNMMQPSQYVQFVESYMKPYAKHNQKLHVPPFIEQHYSSPEVDGRIGSLRVEVLGCVGLSRAKPDIAVYLVCGDSAFCTDVVTSCQSPMWPNVSRRAAVFALHHGYARLYVGVFDVRAASRKSTKENDDFCGRVVLDIATLRPGTEYDVTFPLRVSSFIYDRRPRGVIRLRFSLHWFNERHAILSYWRSPHSTSSSLANRQPTIPCADPKTFRNVAVTVYGRDFPGKYSRKAFRATMREFNLYQQNLRHWIKTVLMDAVFYEKPMMSFYLFLAWMHCIQANSVRLVPAYFIGYLIYLFCDSYMRYNQDAKCHLGYQPVTLKEVLRVLINVKPNGRKSRPKLSSSAQSTNGFKPLLVRKKPKKNHYMRPAVPRGTPSSGTPLGVRDSGSSIAERLHHSESGGEEDKVEYLNHREFPFSERHEYAKFAVDDALASTAHKNQVNANGGKDHQQQQRLVGRLSIYVQHVDIGVVHKHENDIHSSFDEDDSSDMSDRAEQEDETVMTEGDLAFDDSDMDDEDETMNPTSTSADSLNVSARDKRRICTGPPQNNDVMPLKRIPPQVHLARIEAKLHQLSLGLANELIHVPVKWVDETLPLGVEPNLLGDEPDNLQSSGSKKKKKKLHWDDFDKLLRLRERHPNPVLRITSAFLGPLMRMLRIFLYAVRVSFNVTTWRDPFLSFWVLATLIFLFVILLVFPWRAFLFLAGWVSLGPQNILVRRYLEKQATEIESKENETETEAGPTPHQTPELQTSNDDLQGEKVEQKSGARRGLQSRLARLKEKRDEKRRAKRGESPSAGADVSSDVNEASNELLRPAFSTQFNGKQSKKAAQPREIVVPYSRLRKERFYDWPPDPTVSRATPIALVEGGSGSFDNSMSDIMQRDKSGATRRLGDRRVASADQGHSRRQATFGEFSPFVKMPSDSDTATNNSSRSPALERRHLENKSS